MYEKNKKSHLLIVVIRYIMETSIKFDVAL